MSHDIDADQIISLVEERPVLWDKTEEDYKDKIIKKAAWKDVCKILFPDFHDLIKEEKTKLGNAVIKKWTGIKDNYLKYVKKLQELNKAGAATKKIKEYYLYKQLLFLNKNAQNERVGSVIIEEGNNKDKNLGSPKKVPNTASRFVPSRKRKSVDPLEKETLSILQQPENRHVSFFKSILPSLDKLNDHQTLLFQSRVLQILTDLYEPSSHYPQSGYSTAFQGNDQIQRVQCSWQTTAPVGYQTVQGTSRNTCPPSQTSLHGSQDILSPSPSIHNQTNASECKEDAITNISNATDSPPYFDFS